MAKNIVYIQANEKIAQSFREMFSERGIELTVATSGQEALEIMARQDVGLLLVDINIPDMRLSKLVEICSRDFPTVIMNVCVDVYNSLLVTKLVNRHAIHKIFVAPWDVHEMINEIEESLDAAEIAREQVLHEKKLMQESDELQGTLHSLTEALKRQQYSYGKIRVITDLFFSYILQTGGEDEENNAKTAQLKKIFDTYLKMQITESIEIDKFEDVIRADIEKLTANAPGFCPDAVSSCLIEGVPKFRAADIRFALWLIVYATLASAADGSGGDAKTVFRVDSALHSSSQANFILKVSGGEIEKNPFFEQVLSDVLDLLATDVRIDAKEQEVLYDMTFPINRTAS